MASMRHEVRHSHRSAAQIGHIRPTRRQQNSDAASAHDDPRGDFPHQHAPRTGMSFAKTVALMSSIVATTSCGIAFSVESRMDNFYAAMATSI